MPDIAMHYYFGRSVQESLPDGLLSDPDQFVFALSGPDDWFYCFTNMNLCLRAAYMHRNRTGRFLRALAAEPALFSYFAGYFCHYILDATCHPYIISRSGSYKLTKETRQYRGKHTALEHAIDQWILKKHGNIGNRPITDTVFGKPLPAELEEPVNIAYRKTFGWNDTFPDLLKAKHKMRRYLRILEDPHGTAKMVTTLFPHPLLRPLPYSRRYYEDEDFLNLSHQTWHHPKDPSMISTASIPQLIEQARQEAVDAILAVSEGDLSMIGNRSYLTGLDLDDPRNDAKESYVLIL